MVVAGAVSRKVGKQQRSKEHHNATANKKHKNNPHINNNKKKMTRRKKDNEGLSACLLINDENPRLPEWLAYHYTVLPLRTLILTIDPASRSSPTSILDRWMNNMNVDDMLGLDIIVWNETDYLPRVDVGTGITLHGSCRDDDDGASKRKKVCCEL